MPLRGSPQAPRMALTVDLKTLRPHAGPIDVCRVERGYRVPLVRPPFRSENRVQSACDALMWGPFSNPIIHPKPPPPHALFS